MHYYSFNIGDYAKHARHLSNEEDLAYRRMLDLYYLEERPLPKDAERLCRLIGMRENKSEIEYVLETFFILDVDGYHNNRADKDIAEYHAKADTARANGRKGGRPKKTNPNPEKTQSVILANQTLTESEPNPNPEKTESKANHKPITNNHKPNNIDRIEDAFTNIFWAAYHKKQGKAQALKAFKSAVKREGIKDYAEFASMLVSDCKKRTSQKQFGFDNLSASTYLNNNRWEDEVTSNDVGGDNAQPDWMRGML